MLQITKLKCRVCGAEWEYEEKTSYPIYPSRCPDCNGKEKCATCGKIFTLTRDGSRMDCPECEKKINEERVKQYREEIKNHQLLMIPEKYRDLMTDRKDLLESKFRKSLFITGKHGVGKTVFLYSLAKKHIEHDEQIKIIRFTSWIMELQSMFRAESADPFDYAKGIAGFKGMLFIDDLGAEKTTEYVRQIIYYVLDEREQGNLKTVITSNFSLNEIDTNIDQRSSSRIAGMCEVLIFKGDDRRISKGGRS